MQRMIVFFFHLILYGSCEIETVQTERMYCIYVCTAKRSTTERRGGNYKCAMFIGQLRSVQNNKRSEFD